MLQGSLSIQASTISDMKIEDFGELQSRYQALSIAERAKTVLEDAQPALKTARRVIDTLKQDKNMKSIFDKMRKNSMLIAKIRPSDARTALMDKSCDFLSETSHKLAAWEKTMERLSQGEAISSNQGGKEYIRADEPLALLVSGAGSISHYTSIIQIALMDLSRKSKAGSTDFSAMTAEIRRCSTVLSDYENASLFHTLVH